LWRGIVRKPTQLDLSRIKGLTGKILLPTLSSAVLHMGRVWQALGLETTNVDASFFAKPFPTHCGIVVRDRWRQWGPELVRDELHLHPVLRQAARRHGARAGLRPRLQPRRAQEAVAIPTRNWLSDGGESEGTIPIKTCQCGFNNRIRTKKGA